MRASDFEGAIARGVSAEDVLRKIPSFERSRWLTEIAESIAQHRNEFAVAITQDVGKTIRESHSEVARAIDTFTLSAEEALRIGGEKIPMDRTLRGAGSWGITQRFPIGLCGFISPFNFPLNLSAHKIGPAVAVGNPFVLKMASVASRTAQLLTACLASVGMPAGSWSILMGDRETADVLVTDPRIKLVSFTGSPEVGWAMKSRAGKKSVILELGGNAAVVLENVVDLDAVALKIAIGAYSQAGQSCISVQRILVNASLMSDFLPRFIAHTERLCVGDPLTPKTDVGPLVSESSARRVETWVGQAVAAGATVLTGGRRDGAFFSPTLLGDVSFDQPVMADEVFGPVAVIISYVDFEEALSIVNESKFGLQVGLFTSDYTQIMTAFEMLDVGGVIVGNVPGFRLDHTPYGGVKDSGLGREGVRSAIAHMTEEKLLVLNPK